MSTIYLVQQAVRGNWETLPEGEFEAKEAALDAMAELESDMGWRDLRVVADRTNDGLDVILYGLESSSSDED